MKSLRYDDTLPFDGEPPDGWRDVKLCDNDPRPNKNSFDLGGFTPGMPDGETTCMLQSTDSAGANSSNRSFDVWLFTLIDGARSGG